MHHAREAPLARIGPSAVSTETFASYPAYMLTSSFIVHKRGPFMQSHVFPKSLAVCVFVFFARHACQAGDAVSPTYHRDVEPLIQKHCQDCHRPGQVAPFSLLSYEQAKKRGSDIASVVESHAMPPWSASTKEGGPFRDARVLTDKEISLLNDWVDNGCPEGDLTDAPKPRKFTSEWPLGKPDLIVKVPEAYQLSADGGDEFMVFVVPSGLTEGKWIEAIDFQPGNTKVVHHILSAFDTSGRAREKDEKEPGPGYRSFGGFGVLPTGRLAGWAPGKLPRPFPEGCGKYLPAGSDLLIQIHYHKSGKPETDATSMGLYFAKKPIEKQVRAAIVPTVADIEFKYHNILRQKGRGFVIPANDSNVEFAASTTIGYDSHLIAVLPHMHLLGKDFVMTATTPDGTQRTLIKVDHWNFNWQSLYEYETPIALPRGTRIDVLAHFDNSDKNPDNPNHPPKDVHWGEQTTDEMCIGFLQLTADAEHLNNQPPRALLKGARQGR